MEPEQINQLIARIEESKLSKFILKQGNFELHLEKEVAVRSVAPIGSEPVMAAPEPAPSAAKHSESSAPGKFVTSPMVGTFYASPAPGQSFFVKVGDAVQPGTVVCIIEAMKVMNEVKAGVAGKIAEILIENGQPVEFGTRLFRIQ